ncbi:hypothetical protein [Actinomadura atramentaria]|uniref:hypothetical protein n=1 Tax=Actinomadura atramentaria TaxID=1990 RepID=UPI0003677AD7|nr:hypothetical protein [Actinomadura atramentaria]
MTPRGAPAGVFSAYVRRRSAEGHLVVQPRMGFGDVAAMRRGLERVRAADAVTVGTMTLDSFTRVGDHDAARRAVESDASRLNGFPLLAYAPETTRQMLDGVVDDDFPVQVRHGTPLPGPVIAGMAAAGLRATEGGPVSYSLPYGRRPITTTADAWARACRALAAEPGGHVETFGGCMLGQLCPPSLLVAISVLEALFFREHGVRSVSLSYAQQTNAAQDACAVAALRALAGEFLGDVDWHVVLYTFMGVFPASAAGARRLSEVSVAVARAGGADRLIVKTSAEARRIPTIEENVEALEAAHRYAVELARDGVDAPDRAETARVSAEAAGLVRATLRLAPGVGGALVEAFRRGVLDVPFCIHPDNANASRPSLAADGRLAWAAAGAMPVAADGPGGAPTADGLLAMLSFNSRRFDGLGALGALDGLGAGAAR